MTHRSQDSTQLIRAKSPKILLTKIELDQKHRRFRDQANRVITSFEVPTLGIHVLSSFLQKKGYNARTLRLYCPSPLSLVMLFLADIGRDSDKKKKFEANPYAFIQNIDPQDQFYPLRQSLDQWLSTIHQESADIIGFSADADNFEYTALLAAALRSIMTDKFVVLGGSSLQKDSFHLISKKIFTDAIVLGEGEQAFYQLIEGWRLGTISPVPGSLVLKGDQFISGGDAYNPIDLNTLPIPDFSGFDGYTAEGLKTLPIEFSRSCVAKCKFCSDVSFWGGYRQMRVDKAIDNLKAMKEKYAVERFFFAQSLMNGDMAWLETLCLELIRHKVDVTWGGTARIHPKMTREFINLMYDAGCRYLYIGLESGSRATLISMKKGLFLESAKQVLTDASELGIWVHTLWMFGFERETENELVATFDSILDFASVTHSHRYSEYFPIERHFPEEIYYTYRYIFKENKRKLSFYHQNRKFFSKLFAYEGTLAAGPGIEVHSQLNSWAQRRPDIDRARIQRTIDLRRFTILLGKSYIQCPDLRQGMFRWLNLDRFKALFSEFEDYSAQMTDPQRLEYVMPMLDKAVMDP